MSEFVNGSSRKALMPPKNMALKAGLHGLQNILSFFNEQYNT